MHLYTKAPGFCIIREDDPGAVNDTFTEDQVVLCVPMKTYQPETSKPQCLQEDVNGPLISTKPLLRLKRGTGSSSGSQFLSTVYSYILDFLKLGDGCWRAEQCLITTVMIQNNHTFNLNQEMQHRSPQYLFSFAFGPYSACKRHGERTSHCTMGFLIDLCLCSRQILQVKIIPLLLCFPIN